MVKKYFKKILVIAAHHDDIEMGCGGSIAKLINDGYKVDVIIVCDSSFSSLSGNILRSAKVALKEGINGLKRLGIKRENIICFEFPTHSIKKNYQVIKEKILNFIDNKNYDYLFCHWIGDAHLDHRVLSEISFSVGKRISTILQFRSNFYFSEIKFDENYYINIDDFFNLKLKAIKEHKSEMKRTKNSWLEYFIHKNKSDGIKIGHNAAESFNCVISIIK